MVGSRAPCPSARRLAPSFPRLKEWAYAGIFFEMTGAAASHAARGDYGAHAYHLIVTLTFAGLTVASWALRPQSRTPARSIHEPAACRRKGRVIRGVIRPAASSTCQRHDCVAACKGEFL